MAQARGDATGLALPVDPAALLAAGPEWLTSAFRAFGALDEGLCVVAITAHEPCLAGNSGEKLRLRIRLSDGREEALFAKFSRCLADPFRDRRRHELEAEVRLARLSRHPAFPVTVAHAWFADFEAASGTGLLVSSAIAFGEGGVLPLRAKCMDHELPGHGLDHYRATLSALARLAAAYRSGALSPEVEALFPYERAAAEADIPVSCDAHALQEKALAMRAFIIGAPRLFPASVRDPAYLDRMAADVALFAAHEGEIRAFLHADPAFVALAHWNTNLDNAWFWRDDAGALHCGLLDWGMVRVMNLAWGIWGGLSAADPELWDTHGDALLAHFAREYRAHGGPALDPEALRLHLDLSVFLLGMALMMDLPALVAARLPEAARASGPHDPLFARDQVVHGFLHVTANFLNLWARHDFAASVRKAIGA